MNEEVDETGWHGEEDVLTLKEAYEAAFAYAYEIVEECEPVEARNWYNLLREGFDMKPSDAKNFYGSLMTNVDEQLDPGNPDPVKAKELLELANEVKEDYREPQGP